MFCRARVDIRVDTRVDTRVAVLDQFEYSTGLVISSQLYVGTYTIYSPTTK
jgi:hypothetical protein